MADQGKSFHAHVYYSDAERPAAAALRDELMRLSIEASDLHIPYVGRMVDGPVGPHPIPQFELHFNEVSRAGVIAIISAASLRALIHPLTDDDMADHTSLAQWIGDPVVLDLSVLDPLGQNKGVPRFGKRDF
ncbi:MAG: DOPA 4,5-dioxygenase family protein [Pseudomonadota bacterium]